MLKIYRPDEGTKVRVGMTACIGGLAFWGVYCFYGWVAGGWWSDPIGGPNGIGMALGSEMPIDPRTIVCTLMSIAIAVGLYILHNNKRWADFLIDTEAELKKVSWASKRQVLSESLVVVATVIVLSVYIFSIDMVVATFQKRLPRWMGYKSWNAFFDGRKMEEPKKEEPKKE